MLDQRFQAEELLVAAGAPAQQGHKVDQRFGKIAFRHIIFHRHVPLALAQLGAVGIEQQGEVGHVGRFPTQRLIDLQMLGHAEQPFLPADDVGDPHQVIVHHHRQVIGGKAVGFQQHLIVYLFVLNTDGAAHQVFEHRLALPGHLQADHVGIARVQPGFHLRRTAVAPGAVIARRLTGSDLPLAHCLQLFRGAEAVVGAAVFHHLRGIAAVDLGALRLDVGAVPAVTVGAFVILDAGPLQAVHQLLHRPFHQAGLVGILDAQNELPAMLFGVEVTIQCRTQPPHVQVAGGAGSETGSDGLVGHSLPSCSVMKIVIGLRRH